MKEINNKFLNGIKIDFEEIDPFYDKKNDFLFGKAICLIKNNIYRFSIDLEP